MSSVFTLDTLTTNKHGQFVILPQKQIDRVLEVLQWLTYNSLQVEVWKN